MFATLTLTALRMILTDCNISLLSLTFFWPGLPWPLIDFYLLLFIAKSVSYWGNFENSEVIWLCHYS